MYQAPSQPWCLISLRPNLQHQILNRFQHRHEAEAHLRVLNQLAPSSYMVMFDQAEAADLDEDLF